MSDCSPIPSSPCLPKSFTCESQSQIQPHYLWEAILMVPTHCAPAFEFFLEWYPGSYSESCPSPSIILGRHWIVANICFQVFSCAPLIWLGASVALGMIQIEKVGKKGFESRGSQERKGFLNSKSSPYQMQSQAWQTQWQNFYLNSQNCHRIETIGMFPPGKTRRKHSQARKRRTLCGCPQGKNIWQLGSMRIKGLDFLRP